MLFGTTAQGPQQNYYNKGYGTVFEISPEAPPEVLKGQKLCFGPSGHRAK
jgi:hypothetical protein